MPFSGHKVLFFMAYAFPTFDCLKTKPSIRSDSSGFEDLSTSFLKVLSIDVVLEHCGLAPLINGPGVLALGPKIHRILFVGERPSRHHLQEAVRGVVCTLIVACTASQKNLRHVERSPV